ncbi:MAG: hypothetical protein KGN34_05335 [Sphingomonadales bacterium]|nr:hypothetical protein [Sphingomonadales bacterium]
MAKSQKRSNREVRKPKATKTKDSIVAISGPDTAVNKLMQKPKGKL